MRSFYDNPLYRGLIVYYGFFQAVHLALNSAYFIGLTSLESFPPPPPGGWQGHISAVLTGMAMTDLIVILLSVFFIFGYVSRRPWTIWTGLISLATYVYSTFVFSYYTIVSGAWPGNMSQYAVIYVTSVPLFVLLAVLVRECHRLAKTSPVLK